MDDPRRELRTIRKYLDETHTMLHAGAETQETLGALLVAIEKLTEVTAALAEKVEAD